jgi:DNA polymerase (family 10)
LKQARALASRALARLERNEEALRLAVTGGVRRMEPWCGRVDLLATAHAAGPLLDALAEAPFLAGTLERTPGVLLVRTKEDVHLRLEVLADEARFGAALLRTTGPDAYVAALHAHARAQGLAWDGDRLHAGDEERGGPEENDILAALGLPWQPPERRGFGPLDEGTPAGLIEMRDVLGAAGLHAGSGPGRYGFDELASRAAREGYAWAVVLGGDPGLEGPQRPVEGSPFVAFPAVALTVSPSGQVAPHAGDASDALRFAYVGPGVATAGTGLTDLLVRAAGSRHVDVLVLRAPDGLGGPHGAVDPERLLEACAGHGVALGIPPPPHHLLPEPGLLEAARARGSQLLLLAEAQDLNSVDDLMLSVGLARRAGVERSQVLNTLDAVAFEAWRRSRRERAVAP